MQFPSHTISSKPSRPCILNLEFSQSEPHLFNPTSSSQSNPQPNLFASPTPQGFLIAQDCPFNVFARRVFPPFHSTLSHVQPVDSSSLLILVGGGRAPRWSPNKVILWDQDAVVNQDPSFRKDEASGNPKDFESEISSLKGSTIFDATSRFEASQIRGVKENVGRDAGIKDKGKGREPSLDLKSQAVLSVNDRKGSKDYDRIREWQLAQTTTTSKDLDDGFNPTSNVSSNSKEVNPKDQFGYGNQDGNVSMSSLLEAGEETLPIPEKRSQSTSRPSSLQEPSSSISSNSNSEEPDPGIGRSYHPKEEEEDEDEGMEAIPDEDLEDLNLSTRIEDETEEQKFEVEKPDLKEGRGYEENSDEDGNNEGKSEEKDERESTFQEVNPELISLPDASFSSLLETSGIQTATEGVAMGKEAIPTGSNSLVKSPSDAGELSPPMSSSYGPETKPEVIQSFSDSKIEERRSSASMLIDGGMEASSAGLDDPFQVAGNEEDEILDTKELKQSEFEGFEEEQSIQGISEEVSSSSGFTDLGQNTEDSSIEASPSGQEINSEKKKEKCKPESAPKSHQFEPEPVNEPEPQTTTQPTRPSTNLQNPSQSNPQTQPQDIPEVKKTTTSKGRPVAELEFPQTVRGVCVRRFQFSSPTSREESRASVSTQKKDTKSERKLITRTILAAVLDSKVVVFELGAGVGTQPKELDESKRESVEENWGMVQRAVIEVWDGKSGLGGSGSSSNANSRGKGTGTGLEVKRSKLGSGLASISPMKTFASKPARSGSKPTATYGALLAILGRQVGHVQLIEIPLFPTSSSPSNLGASSILAAHTSPIVSLSLSPSGSKLITASEKGTVLRIWSTGVGENQEFNAAGPKNVLLRELRRGTDPARILSMKFSPDENMVAVGSDKGTVHIFKLRDNSKLPSYSTSGSNSSTEKSNKSTSASSSSDPISSTSSGKSSPNLPPIFNKASKFLPSKLTNLANSIPSNLLPTYFSSVWSDSQFRIPLKSFLSEESSGSSSFDENYLSSGRSSNSPDLTAGEEGRESIGGGGSSSKKTTEGAWANMRGRIKDLKKGEVGSDEKLWLNWCEAGTKDLDQDAKRKTPKESGKKAGFKDEESEMTSNDEGGKGEEKYHLIAVTSSGGWYRVSIDENSNSSLSSRRLSQDHFGSRSTASSKRNDESVVLDMYRADSTSSPTFGEKKKERTNSGGEENGGCRLVEYRRFGETDIDGW